MARYSNNPSPSAPSYTWLLVIACFKLIKGALLLAVGIGALSLLHRDSAEAVRHWITLLHGDPDNRYFNKLLLKLAIVDDRQLAGITAGSFFYAGLLLTESIGLSLRKRWAEYFTIIVTGSFIPLEVYELVRRFSALKIIIILINLAVIWYLVVRLLHERRSEAGHPAQLPPKITA